MWPPLSEPVVERCQGTTRVPREDRSPSMQDFGLYRPLD